MLRLASLAAVIAAIVTYHIHPAWLDGIVRATL